MAFRTTFLRVAMLCATPVAVVPAWAPAEAAYTRHGRVEMVTTHRGTPPPGRTYGGKLDGSGRYVAFTSHASDVVGVDRNNSPDAFVRDRRTGKVERVSVGNGRIEGRNVLADTFFRKKPGGAGAADANLDAISRNGRWAVFTSCADNLVGSVTPDDSGLPYVPIDNNLMSDVFVRDRLTHRTEIVSVTSDGLPAQQVPPTDRRVPDDPRYFCNPGSELGSISDDGRYVAFRSVAANLDPVPTPAPGTHVGSAHVYVRDRVKKRTWRVSTDPLGIPALAGAHWGMISGNGRHVVFNTIEKLLPDDTNDTWDGYVRDLEKQTLERVTVDWRARQLDGSSFPDWISADGNLVGFSSLSPATPTALGGVPALRDRGAKRTERVFTSSAGAEGGYYGRVFSRNGRWFVGAHPDCATCVYDRHLGALEPASFDRQDKAVTWDRYSTHFATSISDDGRFVAFNSGMSYTVKSDELFDRQQVYIRDRGTVGSLSRLRVRRTGRTVSVSGGVALPGRVIARTTDSRTDARKDGTDDIGQEITGVSVTYQREDEQLMLRMTLADMPTTGNAVARDCSGGGDPNQPYYPQCDLPHVGGDARVMYRFRFTAAGRPYQIRAHLGHEARAVPPTHAIFGLFRCGENDLICEKVADLRGGLGVSGPEVRVGISLALLKLREGEPLSGLRGETVLLTTAPVVPAPPAGFPRAGILDSTSRLTVVIPVARLTAVVTSPHSPGHRVTRHAALARGRFAFEFPGWSAARGRYTVTTTTCLGTACRTERR